MTGQNFCGCANKRLKHTHKPCEKQPHALVYLAIFHTNTLQMHQIIGVTQAIFVDLFKRGEIIEDLRPNIYDPIEGTTIADAEVEAKRRTQLVDVRWLTESGDELIISTTRPELICACGVVVVHPDDERYSHLVDEGCTTSTS